MEQSDRSVILNNIEELIRVTDYELLKEKCQNIKLLSSVMVNYIEVSHSEEFHKHFYFFFSMCYEENVL